MIRKAETKDLSCISELVSVPPFTYDNTPYDIEWLSILIDKGIFLVYESNNVIKGCIVGEKLLCDGCMLWFLVVDKKYQDSIIGPRLYLQFEKECKDNSITWLIAYGFKTTEKMLERGGFSTNGSNYKEFFKSLEENNE